MEMEFRNPYAVRPPGTLVEILSHPGKNDKSVELALFQDHRYAFFFWAKWTRHYNLSENPPCLISLDYHQDLCFPCDTEKKWLEDLNLSNDGDVAFFSWAKMAGNNDGHILSAAYLNLIGNIYVHCRQGTSDFAWADEELIDMYGNVHLIKKFKTFDSLEIHVTDLKDEHVFFDIDLDFFTLNNPYNTGSFEENYTYMTNKEIREMLSINRPLIDWMFKRLRGFTIATEPEHCGGISKSNKLFEIINKLYFEPGLFTPSQCKWKHKNNNSSANNK
jgi:hypothetical protein